MGLRKGKVARLSIRFAHSAHPNPSIGLFSTYLFDLCVDRFLRCERSTWGLCIALETGSLASAKMAHVVSGPAERFDRRLALESVRH